MNNLLNTLRELEREFHHPGVLGASERIDTLLHPEFFEVGKSGVRYSRGEVKNYLSQVTDLPSVTASNYEVHSMGPDCALLVYSSTHTIEGQNIKVLRSSIWRKTAMGWQIFYHQGTVAP